MLGKARQPFIRFEDREHGFNAEASERAGRPIPKVTTMIIVTSHGSKDEFVAPAVEWLASKRAQAIQGNFDPEWAEDFQKKYDAYLKGNELPLNGTPVKTWQAATREQGIRLHALGVQTVEDLAQYPDGSLSMIGLDGRALRDLARSWIAEGQDKGVVARQLADANVKISDQQTRIDSLEAQVNSLMEKLTEPKKSKAA